MAHTARLENATISVANTATNGTGTIATVVVGANQGTRVDYVMVKAVANTTAGMVRLFTRETGAGTWRLLTELPVTAVVGNAFTPFWSTPFRLPAIYLGHNQELGASTQNAESFTVTAMCLDYQ
jgi:hypothetical protein